MTEEWKDISGYEGYYQVSAYGRVKRLEREVRCNTGTMVRSERVLKPYLDKKTGYLRVTLSKESKMKRIPVHRLVVRTFITNLNSAIFTDTNHIDGDKTNNNILNLELCTRKHNVNHAHENGLMPDVSGEKNPFYGKKHTEETKNKIRAHHKGKRLSESHKKNISESIKGAKNPMFGKAHPLKGKKRHYKEDGSYYYA